MTQVSVEITNEKDLSEISRIYTELLQVTDDFLQRAAVDAPGEDDVAIFCERRAALLTVLQPLICRQQEWLDNCERATLSETVVERVDAQLEQMRQLEKVNTRLEERIALLRTHLDLLLGQVRSGKKALSGYGKGPKDPPRFCRGTV